MAKRSEPGARKTKKTRRRKASLRYRCLSSLKKKFNSLQTCADANLKRVKKDLSSKVKTKKAKWLSLLTESQRRKRFT